ncbi:MAG: hypothetical protein ABSF91_11530 [Bacteroidota bacterium]|jgi:hypothetical protein
MEKQNNPKLELKLNESVRLKLLKDRCYEGNNAYGPFYLYSVSNGDGVEMSFFAPAEIHQQIIAHGLAAGSEFILHKKASQNGKKITGELVFEAVPGQSPAKPSNGNVADRFKEIMQQSLQDAIDITRSMKDVPFQAEDLRSICSCLFIARTRTNGHSF